MLQKVQLWWSTRAPSVNIFWGLLRELCAADVPGAPDRGTYFSQDPIEPSFPLSSTLFSNLLCCITRQMQLGQAGISGKIYHGCSISTTSYKAVFKSAAQSLAEGGVPNCWMDTFPLFNIIRLPKFFFAKTKHNVAIFVLCTVYEISPVFSFVWKVFQGREAQEMI